MTKRAQIMLIMYIISRKYTRQHNWPTYVSNISRASDMSYLVSDNWVSSVSITIVLAVMNIFVWYPWNSTLLGMMSTRTFRFNKASAMAAIALTTTVISLCYAGYAQVLYTYMRWGNMASLVQIMAHRQFGANPLHEPMLVYGKFVH